MLTLEQEIAYYQRLDAHNPDVQRQRQLRHNELARQRYALRNQDFKIEIKARRSRASMVGKCSRCIGRWATDGMKTCEVCRDKAKKYESR